jgi:NADPH-dependent glutamate synthase beta subunit-like oxidoreductase
MSRTIRSEVRRRNLILVAVSHQRRVLDAVLAAWNLAAGAPEVEAALREARPAVEAAVRSLHAAAEAEDRQLRQGWAANFSVASQ